MTHRLLLLRHAKSSWDDSQLDDHDRPLAERGRRAAEDVGARLRESGLAPDLVLCSTATRTRQTLELLDLEQPAVRFEDRLYGADAEELLEVVRELPEEAGAVLVIGHNPGMHDLALRLAAAASGPEADHLRERFPTAALAVFESDGGWAELAAGGGRLRSYVTPRARA
jgi:phosphohistidine phosphatase